MTNNSSAMRVAKGLLGALSTGMLLGGCVAFMPDRIHYEWQPEDVRASEAVQNEGDGEAFVGLALSGGGSRAAVFAAAGAEALQAHGWLDQVTHISGVSGGSFAAAHLAALPPGGCVPSGRNEESCQAEYFTGFKTTMRTNYLYPMGVRQVVRPGRFLSPTRRITSLGDVLDDKFLSGRTFADLPAHPALYINAASYDTSRRFVFSNRQLPPAPVHDDEEIRARDAFAVGALQANSFALDGCSQATPDDLPLSLAVATSAAFPPALGPVTIAIKPGCGETEPQYWHLGDGGILENTGVETLQEVLVRRAHGGHPPARAIIFSFDAGKWTDEDAFTSNPDLRLWTSDPGRVVSISYLRGEAYRDLVWQEVERELGLPVEIVTFRYTDADIGAWPETCQAGSRRANTPGDHLKAIPTSLKITECDADLMEEAAHMLVAEKLAAMPDPVGGKRGPGL